MRYVQVQNEDGSFSYVETARRGPRSLDIHVQKDIEPFRSVVDGSVITSRRDLAAHNERNGCVHESEFGTDSGRKSFLEHKAAERADLYQGTQKTAYGRTLAKQRKDDIIEAVNRHERS